jgi:DNA helicase HerA-like ATPase
MGPVLLSRILGLSEAQEGAINIVFKLADEEGLAILDLKDFRALLSDLATRGKEIRTDYGNVTSVTIGSIQRRLVVLDEQGAANFFGEPALDIKDIMRTTQNGRGLINILAADQLMASPQLYATFLLWLLSELFEDLPEVGDPEKPRLVFFFDEAHLLFTDAPPALLQKIEQVVKLVRSKGVGVYFVTQNPLDIPNSVLAQLGNRIQHALRAYTPREQKAVKTAADTFRPNPAFDTEKTITELAVGEALVSVLDLKGVPTMVERTLIRPPSGRLGAITPEERAELIKASPLYGRYDQPIDRESAYELLAARTARSAQDKTAAAEPQRPAPAPRPAPERPPAASRARETATDRFVKNVAGSVGRQVGNMVVRQLVRGILGGLSR